MAKTVFPILQLPAELRDQIYRHAAAENEIQLHGRYISPTTNDQILRLPLALAHINKHICKKYLFVFRAHNAKEASAIHLHLHGWDLAQLRDTLSRAQPLTLGQLRILQVTFHPDAQACRELSPLNCSSLPEMLNICPFITTSSHIRIEYRFRLGGDVARADLLYGLSACLFAYAPRIVGEAGLAEAHYEGMIEALRKEVVKRFV